MRDLDWNTAIAAGGWDARSATVLAVATNGDVGAAIIDTNGDGADIDLDWYVRVDGDWQPGSSGNISEAGSAESFDGLAQWGRTTPGQTIEIEHQGNRHTLTATDTGWWLLVTANQA